MASEIKVTNIKANDGTASLTIADSTGAITEVKTGTIKAADGTAGMTIANSTGAIAASNNLTVSGDLVPSTPLSHRNMIINGAMQVAQRGDGQSHASSSTAYSACDRFLLYSSNNGAVTTNQAVGPTDKGFADSLHVDITTLDTGLTGTDMALILYAFEGKDLQHICKGTSVAKAVILSFWVKSPKTGLHVVEFYDTDNSRHICKTYTIATADTWENHSVSIPADTTGAFTNDNLKSLEILWWLLAGPNYNSGTLQTTWGSATTANRAVGQVNVYDNTSNNFYITGVQLELGSSATPFEHRSYADELARCQRYYEMDECIGDGDLWAFPINLSDGYRRAPVYFKVPKRAIPSVTSTGSTTPGGNQAQSINGFVVTWNGAASGDYKLVTSWTANSEL
jgi:hypothetical protein